MDEAPPIAGPAVRFLPLLVAAVLLGIRVAAAPIADHQWRGFVAVVCGLLLATGVVHAAALRWPRRHAVNGLSWVLTIVALLAAVSVILAADGR
jgi:hypothetical protein